MGRPIEMGLSPDSTLCTVDQMVVSVGPYIFHTDPERARSSSARSRGSASPPHKIFGLVFPASRLQAPSATLSVLPASLSPELPPIAPSTRRRPPPRLESP